MMRETTEKGDIDTGGPGAETGMTGDTEGDTHLGGTEKGDLLLAEKETGDTERIESGLRRQDREERKRRKKTCHQPTNPNLLSRMAVRVTKRRKGLLKRSQRRMEGLSLPRML